MSNRYFQRNKYATFNPMSINELSILPQAKRQQHDALVQTASALKQDKQPTIDIDTELYSKELEKLNQGFEEIASDINERGVNHNHTSMIMTQRDRLKEFMSFEGVGGKAVEQYQQRQKIQEELKDKGFDPGRIREIMAIQDHMYEQSGGVAKDGFYSGIDQYDKTNIDDALSEMISKMFQTDYKEKGTKGLQLYLDPTTRMPMWMVQGKTYKGIPPKEALEAARNYLKNDPQISGDLKIREQFYNLTFRKSLEKTDEGYYSPITNSFINSDKIEEAANNFAEEALNTEVYRNLTNAVARSAGMNVSTENEFKQLNSDYLKGGGFYDPDAPSVMISEGSTSASNKLKPFGGSIIAAKNYSNEAEESYQKGLESYVEKTERLVGLLPEEISRYHISDPDRMLRLIDNAIEENPGSIQFNEYELQLLREASDEYKHSLRHKVNAENARNALLEVNESFTQDQKKEIENNRDLVYEAYLNSTKKSGDFKDVVTSNIDQGVYTEEEVKDALLSASESSLEALSNKIKSLNEEFFNLDKLEYQARNLENLYRQGGISKGEKIMMDLAISLSKLPIKSSVPVTNKSRPYFYPGKSHKDYNGLYYRIFENTNKDPLDLTLFEENPIGKSREKLYEVEEKHLNDTQVTSFEYKALYPSEKGVKDMNKNIKLHLNSRGYSVFQADKSTGSINKLADEKNDKFFEENINNGKVSLEFISLEDAGQNGHYMKIRATNKETGEQEDIRFLPKGEFAYQHSLSEYRQILGEIFKGEGKHIVDRIIYDAKYKLPTSSNERAKGALKSYLQSQDLPVASWASDKELKLFLSDSNIYEIHYREEGSSGGFSPVLDMNGSPAFFGNQEQVINYITKD